MLPSETIPNISRRFSNTGKDLQLLASMIAPMGAIYDPAGVLMAIRRSLPIHVNADTTGLVLAAKEGFHGVVLSFYGTTSGDDGTVQFFSQGESDEQCSAIFNNAALGGEVLSHNPGGWFMTREGEPMIVQTTGGAVDLQVTYVYLNAKYFIAEDLLPVFNQDGTPMLVE